MSLRISAAIERWPVAGQFVIARGAKTHVDVLVAAASDGTHVGLGEGTAIYYHGESDAVIVKGIVSLLVKVLSGCTPDEIINSDLHFIDQIGLKEHLSPTRSNGLLAMVKQMKLYALAYKTKYANS